ncbi:MAG: fructokinase [Thermoleophilaceae bacterium]|nr:fructokinase [Thermoleophilaceae bacterium]
MRTLCLGEALVDLICEHPVPAGEHPDLFRPHFGGATANVCVAAARQGATVALAGGVGDDAWGRWLHARLLQEGVELDWFALLDGVQTPVAFVQVDTHGEPSFSIYGDGIDAAVQAAAPGLPGAVEATDAFSFASNTLVGEHERDVTLSARDHALALAKPVVFDPNLRLHRWRSVDEALRTVRACVPGSFVVKCNASEAQLLTGAPDVESAAARLLADGAQHVVITLGAKGAVLRGPQPLDVPGRAAQVVNTTGAGDAFLGTLLAHLAGGGYDPGVLPQAVTAAVEEGARATERWGAV